LQCIIYHRAFHDDAKIARFGFRPNGSCMASGAWVVVSPSGRRDDTTTAAQPSFSSDFTHSLHLHHSTLCSPPLAPSRTLIYQLIRGCRPHALRSCALVEQSFPRPLLATAKLPAVFYASTIVASESRKRLRSLSLTPQNKNRPPKYRYPTTSHFHHYLNNTESYL
jgi:hypothetical protein